MRAREIIKEVLGIFAVGAAFFLLASLFSYDVQDDPTRVFPPNEHVTNLGGMTGFWLAKTIFEAVGVLGGYGAVSLILFLSLSILGKKEPTKDLIQGVVGGVAVILALSIVERFFAGRTIFLIGEISEDLNGRLAGGYWGTFLEHWLTKSFSTVGLIVVVAMGLSTGTALSAEFFAEGWGRDEDESEAEEGEEANTEAAPLPVQVKSREPLQVPYPSEILSGESKDEDGTVDIPFESINLRPNSEKPEEKSKTQEVKEKKQPEKGEKKEDKEEEKVEAKKDADDEDSSDSGDSEPWQPRFSAFKDRGGKVMKQAGKRMWEAARGMAGVALKVVQDARSKDEVDLHAELRSHKHSEAPAPETCVEAELIVETPTATAVAEAPEEAAFTEEAMESTDLFSDKNTAADDMFLFSDEGDDLLVALFEDEKEEESADEAATFTEKSSVETLGKELKDLFKTEVKADAPKKDQTKSTLAAVAEVANAVEKMASLAQAFGAVEEKTQIRQTRGKKKPEEASETTAKTEPQPRVESVKESEDTNDETTTAHVVEEVKEEAQPRVEPKAKEEPVQAPEEEEPVASQLEEVAAEKSAPEDVKADKESVLLDIDLAENLLDDEFLDEEDETEEEIAALEEDLEDLEEDEEDEEALELRQPYQTPSMDLLSEPEQQDPDLHKAEIEEKSRLIEECLAEFRIEAKVEHVERGPNVTLYALALGKGIKVQRISALLDNLALVLASPGAIRMQAPIRGTCWVGLEVPNERQEMVTFAEIYRQPEWRDKEIALPLFLGKDTAGRPLVADLAKLPHLLVAGATGSGKSVCINTMILSMLMTRSPNDVKMILIDPKQVELAPFGDIPHLLSPVVTDMKHAGAALDWAVQKMEERYNYLAKARVRHLKEYNKLGKEGLVKRMGLKSVEELERQKIPWKLPYIVVVVDELNDLMMVAQKEVEASIMRLAQKSRAIGIHVILATQRPSVDVITGVIKSNLPARLAFQVTSKVDSRTILDVMGAEKLLGMGDMLFLAPGRSQPNRAKGAYVSEEELERVLETICHQRRPNFAQDLVELKNAPPKEDKKKKRKRRKTQREDGSDELFEDAVEVVLGSGRGSVSLLQRKLGIGYARAARIIESMSDQGILGSDRGSKARKVLMSLAQWKNSLG